MQVGEVVWNGLVVCVTSQSESMGVDAVRWVVDRLLENDLVRVDELELMVYQAGKRYHKRIS